TAVRRAEHSFRVQSRDERRRLLGREQPRGDAGCSLNAARVLETPKRSPLVRDEEVAALLEPRLGDGSEARREVAVERERLARHRARRVRAPLLTHTARLDTRGARADTVAVEDRDGADPALEELKGDRDPGDAGTDHAHAHRSRTLRAVGPR